MSISGKTRDLVVWGERYGISKPDVLTLRALVNRYVRMQVYASNGDPHSAAKNREDKDECSRLWNRDSEVISKRLVAFAGKCGLTVVDFSSGIRPMFETTNGERVSVPE